MILYLQVGFEFIYELRVKDTATFCPFWDAMPKGLSMDITIYCFIVFQYCGKVPYKFTATSAICRFSKYSLVHKCRN